ncbi:XdhC family protein [Longimicrobium sp.]|uniref:XdhC family protein n=1 Tax=Longimicrobium sp. TaxID=2029185 RepID=UPI002E355EC9|nr:XdhC family protein [Longimicrobium sp.]HEX6039106.1 XdhC family protein [Longimicrobium sp.]
MTERLSVARAAHHAREALEGGDPVVGLTVLESSPGGPAAGERMCVWAGRHAGTLGDANLDAAALRIARSALADDTRPGSAEVEADGARVTVYLEPHAPPPELVIVGAGHVARPLCQVGAMLGFRVTVLDDRPEFATRERFPDAAQVRRADFADPFRGIRITPRTFLVLVTRGHKYDFEALRGILLGPSLPAYVGMIGSRRRTRAALEALAAEGIAADRLRAVHAPIGLDVGAETPEEIAVSIAAELVMIRRGGTGQPLRDRERVADRWVTRGRGAAEAEAE